MTSLDKLNLRFTIKSLLFINLLYFSLFLFVLFLDKFGLSEIVNYDLLYLLSTPIWLLAIVFSPFFLTYNISKTRASWDIFTPINTRKKIISHLKLFFICLGSSVLLGCLSLTIVGLFIFGKEKVYEEIIKLFFYGTFEYFIFSLSNPYIIFVLIFTVFFSLCSRGDSGSHNKILKYYMSKKSNIAFLTILFVFFVLQFLPLYFMLMIAAIIIVYSSISIVLASNSPGVRNQDNQLVKSLTLKFSLVPVLLLTSIMYFNAYFSPNLEMKSSAKIDLGFLGPKMTEKEWIELALKRSYSYVKKINKDFSLKDSSLKYLIEKSKNADDNLKSDINFLIRRAPMNNVSLEMIEESYKNISFLNSKAKNNLVSITYKNKDLEYLLKSKDIDLDIKSLILKMAVFSEDPLTLLKLINNDKNLFFNDLCSTRKIYSIVYNRDIPYEEMYHIRQTRIPSSLRLDANCSSLKISNVDELSKDNIHKAVYCLNREHYKNLKNGKLDEKYLGMVYIPDLPLTKYYRRKFSALLGLKNSK